MAQQPVANPQIPSSIINQRIADGQTMLDKQMSGTPRFSFPDIANSNTTRDTLLNALLGMNAGSNAAEGINKYGNPLASFLAGVGGAAGAPQAQDIRAAREKAIADSHLQQLISAPIEQVSPDLVAMMKDKFGFDMSGMPTGIVHQFAPIIEKLNEASSGTKLSEQDIESAANAILTGQIAPSQLPGFGKDSLKSKAISKALEKQPGFSIAQAELNYLKGQGQTRFGTSSAVQSPLVYLNSVIPNLSELTKISDDLARTNIKIVNRAALNARMQLGDEQAARFSTVATEVSDQIAKILQGGGTGNGTSDAKLNQAMSLLDQNYSPKQMRAVVGELEGLLTTRRTALERAASGRGGSGPMPQPQLGEIRRQVNTASGVKTGVWDSNGQFVRYE